MRIFSSTIKFCPKTGRPVKPLKQWIIPLFSILALVWVLVRVIPRPQRAAYPCMKVAIPLASSLIIYLGGFLASVIIFKKAFRKIGELRYSMAGLLILIGVGISLTSIFINHKHVYAGETIIAEYEDPLGPNTPIGEARGIIPGRVVWMHNPDATNEN